MNKISNPNAWVSVDADQTTQLTYGARVDPSPLTVSVEGRDPRTGSLEVLLSNPTPGPLAVGSVRFTIVVGKPGSDGVPLTPSTADMHATVSDTTNWALSGPPPVPPISTGTVAYVLGPKTGKTVSLAAGASVSIQIYGFVTVPDPSTSTIAVKETIAGSGPQFTSIDVSTFPAGFYFDSLAATIPSGNALVPVAQVGKGGTTTLTWNSSVVDTENVAIFYSSATLGQQGPVTPSALGRWASPPLNDDTVFVVTVSAHQAGAQPLTASLAASVAVLNPDLVASSVTAGQATINGTTKVTGPLTAAGVTASGLTVNGNATATTATVNGALGADSATVQHNLTAASATVTGKLGAGDFQSGSATVTGSLGAGSITAASITATGAFRATGASVSLFSGTQRIPPAQYLARTDGFVMGWVAWPPTSQPGCVGYVSGATQGLEVYATGGNLGAFGPGWSKYQAANGNTFLLPVVNGTNWKCNAWQTGEGLKQADAPTALFWIPLGTAAAGQATYERIGDVTDELPDMPEPTPRPQDDRQAAIDGLVDVLEPLFAKPLDHETRGRLARAVARI
jgi:hypothetical protein